MLRPVALFDFDGTVIDSGSIIIASMRHATKTVLGREIPDEELGRALKAAGAGQVQLAPEAATRLMREVRTPEKGDHQDLTRRETEVLKLVARGEA